MFLLIRTFTKDSLCSLKDEKLCLKEIRHHILTFFNIEKNALKTNSLRSQYI